MRALPGGGRRSRANNNLRSGHVIPDRWRGARRPTGVLPNPPRPREEGTMRFYRISFLGGVTIGYVLGAQAGRERYEQLKQLARKAAESPAMQQTAGALQAQAQATAKTAKDKATTSVRKGASKVTSRSSSSSSGRTSSSRSGSKRKSGASTSTVSGNGAMPRSGSDDSRPFLADGASKVVSLQR